jgi:hypothetical protein
LLAKLREMDKKGNREENEKLLAKKVYTYDYNGDIVFVR